MANFSFVSDVNFHFWARFRKQNISTSVKMTFITHNPPTSIEASLETVWCDSSKVKATAFNLCKRYKQPASARKTARDSVILHAACLKPDLPARKKIKQSQRWEFCNENRTKRVDWWHKFPDLRHSRCCVDEIKITIMTEFRRRRWVIGRWSGDRNDCVACWMNAQLQRNHAGCRLFSN